MEEKQNKENYIENEMAVDPCFKAVVDQIQTNPKSMVYTPIDDEVTIVATPKMYESIDYPIKSINKAIIKYIKMKLCDLSAVDEYGFIDKDTTTMIPLTIALKKEE